MDWACVSDGGNKKLTKKFSEEISWKAEIWKINNAMEGNETINLMDMGCNDVKVLFQNRAKWLDLVLVVLNLRVLLPYS
jgi:hypothetical protein